MSTGEYYEIRPRAPIKAMWICLIVSWVLLILPIPATVFLAIPFVIASIILAVMCMMRYQTMHGLFGLLGTFVIAPILYLIGLVWLGALILWVPSPEVGSISRQPDRSRLYSQTRNVAPLTELDDGLLRYLEVEYKDVRAFVPDSERDMRAIRFNALLGLDLLPGEKDADAQRPTLAQFEIFRTAVAQMEPEVRRHIKEYLSKQPYMVLNSHRGQALVEAEIVSYVNDQLEKYDFEKFDVSSSISRRRISKVRFSSWEL